LGIWSLASSKTIGGRLVKKVVLALGFWHNERLVFTMKKETSKAPEAQLLDLLKQVLPKATTDPNLAGRIYSAIETELKAKARIKAFEKYCHKCALRDLEPKSLDEVRTQLATSFADGDVTVRPNRKEKTVMVELALNDGHRLTGEIQVNPNAKTDAEDEPESAVKFAPFPVSLPGDPELVWVLGKHENLSPEEASVALDRIQEDFWASKTGQKLQRDRVEKCFPEFIARVPAGLLTEAGLKRHYKTPEPIKVLRGKGQTR